MERPALLQLTQLTYRLGDRTIIDAIDLRLEPAEFIALHGPSGSGKSTLLRAIAGLIKPTSGQVLLNGQTPETIGWPRFRRQVIYLQQKPTLSDASVAENLQRPFHYMSANDAAYDAGRAADLLKQLHLNPAILDQPANTLSVGEQQRVCQVRALLLEPAVLLLDEPTSALDEDSANATLELLAEAREQRGLSALVATHNHSRLADLCERSIRLDA